MHVVHTLERLDIEKSTSRTYADTDDIPEEAQEDTCTHHACTAQYITQSMQACFEQIAESPESREVSKLQRVQPRGRINGKLIFT